MKDIEVFDTISNLSSMNDTVSPLKSPIHLNSGNNYLYINREFLSKIEVKMYCYQKRMLLLIKLK